MAKKKNNKRKLRCLIVERHVWETGGRQQQLQIPLKVANEFFGAGGRTIRIRVRIVEVGHICPCSISKEYQQSATRRVNGLQLIGSLPSCFIFFQETDESHLYEFWWQSDMAIVAAKYNTWFQGRNSQYGRGRLAKVVPAPVPVLIDRI